MQRIEILSNLLVTLNWFIPPIKPLISYRNHTFDFLFFCMQLLIGFDLFISFWMWVRLAKLYLIIKLYHKIVYQLPTWGLPQVWLDGSTIGSFAKPNFSPGRTSNFDHQILTSTKQFQSSAAPADGILIPRLRQALIVSYNAAAGAKPGIGKIYWSSCEEF